MPMGRRLGDPHQGQGVVVAGLAQAGGVHEGAGTHNMLLGLGPDCYLEVIAPDPAQPQPEHPRLFDLDDAAVRLMLEAGPALIGWVARTSAMDALVARLGPRGRADAAQPGQRGPQHGSP